jgi:hypothetical protein
MKEILKIQRVTKLSKNVQKHVVGGLGEYLESCGLGDDGEPCLTGLPHCPTGRCLTSVCTPDAH